jgi:hypothetical protein
VREPLVRGLHDVELIGAGIGGMAGDWMKFSCCEGCVVEAGRRRGGTTPIDAALDLPMAKTNDLEKPRTSSPDMSTDRGFTILKPGQRGGTTARAHAVPGRPQICPAGERKSCDIKIEGRGWQANFGPLFRSRDEDPPGSSFIS